jgi:hypothetical protein
VEVKHNMPASNLKNCLIALSLSLVLMGCAGAGTQSFLQQSGADYKRGEKIEWVDEPSAEASNWSTYMDLEGR